MACVFHFVQELQQFNIYKTIIIRHKAVIEEEEEKEELLLRILLTSGLENMTMHLMII